MANQKDIEATYDYMDEIFQQSIGKHGDISCARYNGNYHLPVDVAQRAKHEFILEHLDFKKGDRILDIGCGWGPLLQFIKEKGGEGVGLTLSPAQAKACTDDGLNTYIKDIKQTEPAELGTFDAIAGVGCFEHLCSMTDMLEKRQDDIYKNFFKLCHQMLKQHGKLYIQTMAWGKRVPKPEEFDVHAPKLSDAWVLGHLLKYYPGSWLSNGKEHVEKCAEPYFKLLYADDGQSDYIQTLKDWGSKTYQFTLKKFISTLKILPRYFSDQDFRYQITSFRYSCNRIVFERDLFRLPRLVFEAR